MESDQNMKRASKLLLVLIVFGLVSCTQTVPVKNKPTLVSNQFQAVWNQVNSDLLDHLPQDTVSIK
jgi:succinate dehydrogenase hydrophobic anchor subunit